MEVSVVYVGWMATDRRLQYNLLTAAAWTLFTGFRDHHTGHWVPLLLLLLLLLRCKYFGVSLFAGPHLIAHCSGGVEIMWVNGMISSGNGGSFESTGNGPFNVGNVQEE